jgi:hypothetical protein
MALCRVFYRVDGSVAINHPNPRYKMSEETDEEFLDRMASKAVEGDSSLQGLEYEDMDTSQLPDRSNGKRNKWRGAKGQGVHIDESVITAYDIRQQLDEELDKSSPNPVTILKLQRKLQKRDYT